MTDDTPARTFHDRTPFGEVIFLWCKNNNTTQGKFATAIEVNPHYLTQLVRGYRKPSRKTIERIAEYIDIDIEVLFAKAGVISPSVEEFVIENIDRILVLMHDDCVYNADGNAPDNTRQLRQ